MKKIALSSTLSALLLITSVPSVLQAEWYNPLSWFDKKVEYKPVTFERVYPVPFYKTGLFEWGSIIVASVAVAVVTVGTGGLGAVPGATWIGSMLGGLMGTTWAGGLAALGGGALAAGGLGMAGGAVVVATVTDLSLAVLIDQAASVIPKTKGEGMSFSTIKVSIPKWEEGSEGVVKNLNNIHELQDKLMDGDISKEVYTQNLRNYIEDALNKIDIYSNAYDAINGMILAYDIGRFQQAEKYVEYAKTHLPVESSMVYYMEALLLLSNNQTSKALSKLNLAIIDEKDTLNPYLLKINIQMDSNDLYGALQTVQSGLNNYDDDNFQLNYLGGMISYKRGFYKDAIDYFKEALSNITINNVEAECKARIALSYKKLNEYEKANEWFKEALEEVSGKEYKKYREQIEKIFRNQ